MITLKRLKKALAMIGAIIVTGAGLLVAAPSAVADEVTCDSGFGAKVPVLMVHGFGSNPRMWAEGDPSMDKSLQPMNNMYVARAFDYEKNHFDWIAGHDDKGGTDAIGYRLAATIDCLSQASKKGGGAGKVVIVAHSMGGLATLYASWQTMNGRKIVDELAGVVTIATPYLGSDLATLAGDWRGFCATPLIVSFGTPNRTQEVEKCQTGESIAAMQMGSPQLSKLPRQFPAGVPVRAIAGEVRLTAQLLFAPIAVSLGGDIVVPVSSATARYTNTGSGDGNTVFPCAAPIIPVPYNTVAFTIGNMAFNAPSCWHNEIYKNATVQEVVKRSVAQFIASVQGTMTDFYGLQLRLPSGWKVKSLSDTKDASDTAHCTTPSVCASFSVYGPQYLSNLGSSWLQAMSDLPECSADDESHHDASIFGPIVAKGTRTVGGKEVKYYEAQLCAAGYPQETMRMWKVDQPNLLIVTTAGRGQDVSNIDALLENASWK